MRKISHRLIIATILVALAAILYPALVLNTGAEGVKEIPPDKTVLAIYSIEARGVDASLAEALSPFLMGAINNNRGAVKIVQNEAVSKALEQQGLASSGACSDTECLPALGKILGANRFLVTSLTKLGKKYTIHATVYDAESAVAMFTDREECHCSEDQLNIPVERLANRVMARLNGKEIKQPDFKPSYTPATDAIKPKTPALNKEDSPPKGTQIITSFGKFNITDRLIFNPNLKYFAIQIKDIIKVYDTSNGKIIKSYEGNQHSRVELTFNYDGSYLAFGVCGKVQGKGVCKKPSINIYDILSGTHLAKIDIKTTPSGYYRRGINRINLSFSSDGKFLAYNDINGKILVWDITSKKEIYKLSGHNYYTDKVSNPFAGAVNNLLFHPNGKLIFSSGGHNDKASVKLWDVSTGKEVIEFSDFAGTLSLSPNGELLAQRNNRLVRIWNMSSKEPSSVLIGGNVAYLAFGKDSKTLITIYCNKLQCSVKKWNTETGCEIGIIASFEGKRFLSFSSDGKRIALINLDGNIQIMELDSDK